VCARPIGVRLKPRSVARRARKPITLREVDRLRAFGPHPLELGGKRPDPSIYRDFSRALNWKVGFYDWLSERPFTKRNERRIWLDWLRAHARVVPRAHQVMQAIEEVDCVAPSRRDQVHAEVFATYERVLAQVDAAEIFDRERERWAADAAQLRKELGEGKTSSQPDKLRDLVRKARKREELFEYGRLSVEEAAWLPYAELQARLRKTASRGF
jgi:hypothetical protein